ncbi:hypothetical protein LINPERHAP1_LOCUS16128 [Linum perenne]
MNNTRTTMPRSS